MKIRIYQINSQRDAEKAHRNIFREYDSETFDKELYDFAFEGTVEADSLDDVFEIFNIRHPEGYKGHSLSVSDVVEVLASDSVENGLYYCQNYGWLKITVSDREVA